MWRGWGFLGRAMGRAADWALLFSDLGEVKGWVVGRGQLHLSPFSFSILDISFSLLVNACFLTLISFRSDGLSEWKRKRRVLSSPTFYRWKQLHNSRLGIQASFFKQKLHRAHRCWVYHHSSPHIPTLGQQALWECLGGAGFCQHKPGDFLTISKLLDGFIYVIE